LLTSGKYGGIGVTIGLREGAIQVITVMDGYSAQRQGILPGDKILEVDSVDVRSRKPDEVRSLTRGEPGTEVKVLVGREGEPAPILFVLIREEIQVKNVTYADFVEDSIAYVRLERFSRRAGEELRQAIKELKLRGEIKAAVLDLRGNPGGLLDAAVDVVSKFVPRNSLIVTTKGRRPEADKKFYSSEEPLLPETPLVLLTDRSSASASEIVSGALQDMDRALIAGTRTFGKGLVQTILPLSYGAQLKITTAKYYIPSGRSIQEIDYVYRADRGVFRSVPDTAKRKFVTAHGREVFEHGGITPDTMITEEDVGPMVKELLRKSLFFKFANKYVAEHKGTPITDVTDNVLNIFRNYLDEQKFEFQEQSLSKVRELRELAEELHYGEQSLREIDRLKSELEKERMSAFDRYRNHIKRLLAIELMGRSGGERGRIEASLAGDVQLHAAIALLKDSQRYAAKLGR
jgi:carboxyl-terminal processing protease